MTREEFFNVWCNVRHVDKRTNWQAEDSKYLFSAIEFVDKVLNLVNDIPEEYVGLLELRSHNDRELTIYLSSWNDRVISIYIPKEIIEKELEFDSTVEKVQYYLSKLKALLKKRLEFIQEEITEIEQVFLARIRDLKKED